MLSVDLKQKIDSLWQKFFSNGMADHMNALKHISYLIFMKKLEDYENDRIIAAKHAKKKYESIFDGHEKMRWSKWKDYPGEKMLSHVRNKVFPFFKDLKLESGFKLDLENSNFEIGSPILLQDAVLVINDLKISEQNLDTQGDIYEYVSSKLTQSGLNGAFRTPRHIIQMMISLLDPDVNQKICDPACGTGGFLINSYLHILKKYNSKESTEAGRALGDKLTDKQREFLLNDQLFGFDFERPMTQFSQMNMILHGFKQPNIKYENSVGKQFSQEEEYDVILANPPFAGNLNKSEIHEDFDVKTTKTELLFLELFYNKLVIGGQAAVIVPVGVVAGKSKAHLEIKKKILEKCQLEAIIYLPSGVFEPYSGVSTAVLFFTKGGSTEKIWLYDMENDGFKLDSNHNEPINENDIPDILAKFPNREKSKKSRSITINEIKENNYNLNVHRYIDNSVPEVQIDIQGEADKLHELKKERESLENKMIKDLKELGFKV
jgi:type I restriction enzyme M protein